MATWATRERAEKAEQELGEAKAEVDVLRYLLEQIPMNSEYPKMEAEGLAAAHLGLSWSEKRDRYIRRKAKR